MSRTHSMLSATFGRDLGNLTNAYFQSASNSAKAIGKAGEWERAIALHPSAFYDVAQYGATRAGYIDFAEYLLAKGGSPLFVVLGAARAGNLALVRTFAPRCNNATWPDHVLIYGSRGGHLEIVQYAINAGASNYYVALISACRGGYITIARTLLAISDCASVRAVETACARGYHSLADMIALLVVPQIAICIECKRTMYLHHGRVSTLAV